MCPSRMLRVLAGRGSSSLGWQAIRSLSSAAPAAAPPKVDKEALKTLRQRTGYSFVNCKKALAEFGPSRLEEAEAWLRELAKKEGWQKAAKLSSRQTTQGLVGVQVSGTLGAIVELSCETDFVARGEPFRDLLANLTGAVLAHASKGSVWTNDAKGTAVQRANLAFDELSDVNGRALRDILTESLARIGENLTVKSVAAFRAPEGSLFYAASHPKEGHAGVAMGRFVSLVALKRTEKEEGLFPSARLADQIAQHIIGMRTETLGEPPVQKDPSASASNEKAAAKSDKDDELNEFFSGQTTSVDDSETTLLRQSFMLNPSQTVWEYLQGHKAQVLDFARVELTGAGDE